MEGRLLAKTALGGEPRATEELSEETNSYEKEGTTMSTRSATVVRQEETKWKLDDDGMYTSDGTELREVARFYRHCDGYPGGHGLQMATSFANTEGGERRDWFQKLFGPFMTGMGLKGTDFEAWGAPTLEFEPAGSMHGDLEYLYAVTKRDKHVEIGVWEIGWDERYEDVLARDPLFEGTPSDYIAWVNGR